MASTLAKDDPRRVIHNKLNGEHITFTDFSHETNGEYTRALIECEPGGGPPAHYHASYTERFTALKDPFIVELEGVTHRIAPGESILVEIGQVHRFTNESSQSVELIAEFRPGQPGLEQALAIFCGLATDGLAKADGSFGSPFHAATFVKLSDIRFPGLAGAAFDVFVGSMAAVAGYMGWQAELVKKYCPWMNED